MLKWLDRAFDFVMPIVAVLCLVALLGHLATCGGATLN